jgi:hypothetical protein
MSLDTASIATEQSVEAIRLFLEALDSPRSLAVWLLYSNNEHGQLSSLEFDPFLYNSSTDASNALAATKLLSKATFLNLETDKKAIALAKFYESELQCAEANKRILTRNFSCESTNSVLTRATYLISDILGDFTAEEFIASCNWGPGATTKIKRRDSNHPIKYEFETHITPTAYEFVKNWFYLAYPLWCKNHAKTGFDLTFSSKLITVAKNSKTDRTIAIEPGINLWFQKGIGSMIKKRLLRSGIDLKEQRHNQALSRIAAKFNHLATVDFSSASDTISKEIVRDLFPKRWLSLLEAFRTSTCKEGNHTIILEKFSSMGNGFTFEVESVIFYAVAIACCECFGYSKGDVSVFGDDVILPSSVVPLYLRVCEDIGFKINKQKSYSTGYYRESCGSHYWGSRDIKPIFLKEPLSGKTEVLKFANNVRRLSHRLNYFGCDKRFLRCWLFLRKILGHNCPVISEGYGDLALVDNIHNAKKLSRAPNGCEGYLVPVWGTVPRSIHMDGSGVLLAKLRRLGIGEPTGSNKIYDQLEADGLGDGNNVPLACKTKVAKFRILVLRWYDLGPWI